MWYGIAAVKFYVRNSYDPEWISATASPPAKSAVSSAHKTRSSRHEVLGPQNLGCSGHQLHSVT